MKPIGTQPMYKITHLIEGGDKVASFSHYWGELLNPTGWHSAELVELCDTWHDLISTKWAPLCSDRYRMVATKILFVSGDAQLDATSTADPVVGSAVAADSTGAASHAGETALVIQRRTGYRGRRARGRMFVPGIAEALNRNGYIISTAEDDVEEFCALFTGNQEMVTASEHSFEFAARHYANEKKNSGGDVIQAAEFMVVMDTRWVNKLSTRKDRTVAANIIAR